MKATKLAFFILILFMAISCLKKEPRITSTELIGVWTDDTPSHPAVANVQYYFTFDQEEFLLHIHRFTTTPISTCSDLHHYDQYIKGTYVINNNTLFMRGIYTNSSYDTLTVSNCNDIVPIGNFEHEVYLQRSKNGKIYFLNDLSYSTHLKKN